MPTIIALVFSTAMAYVPVALFGDEMSSATEIVVSSMVATISYYALRSYLRKLRGE
jgi:hypothetical protein